MDGLESLNVVAGLSTVHGGTRRAAQVNGGSAKLKFAEIAGYPSTEGWHFPAGK